jgi:hypothetical protein
MRVKFALPFAGPSYDPRGSGTRATTPYLISGLVAVATSWLQLLRITRVASE